MDHGHPSFNNLPVETLDRIAQLLSEDALTPYSQVAGGKGSDVFPFVPNFRSGFFTSVASLSRVNRRLRAVCKPHLLSYICCKTVERLIWLTGGSYYSDEEVSRPSVLTLSIMLPSYYIESGKVDFFMALSREFYDQGVSRSAALIPKVFPSLNCLRLHHIPNLDDFFKAFGALSSLRILDVSLCDTVILDDKYEEGGVKDKTALRDVIMKNTPPLEVLRITVAFGQTDGNSSRGRVIKQMSALVRASSPTLIEFSFNGFDNLGFDSLKLKRVRCPRLRRLSILSVRYHVSGIRKFILAHQPHLVELNLNYRYAYFNVSLSCLWRIMRGICPREGNIYAIDEEEERIESAVHPEDRKFGHYECDKFAYAKRGGNIVEMTLSFPSIDVNGNDANNDELTVFKLSVFLRQFTHLEILTLTAGRHVEPDVASFMNGLGNLCQRHLRNLRTLHVFFELDEICWGAGTFENDEIYLPGDGSNSDEEFSSDDENDSSGECDSRSNIPFEEYARKWKAFEDKYYFMFESIMTSFFEKAPAACEIFFYFREPREGCRSSCWLWRRIPQRGTKVEVKNATNATVWSRSNKLKIKSKSSSFVVGDMMIQGTFKQPPLFTFTVGKEALYERAFSHEPDRFMR